MQTAAKNDPATNEPWETYGSPGEISDDTSLSAAQKTELLQIWINEVEERLDAASEGMPPHGQTDDDLSLLEKLRVELQRVAESG